MRAIYGKELRSYFYTPVGWLFVSVFLGLASLIFYLNNILPRSSDFLPFLSMMSYVWMLLSPLLVMRLLAGEHRLATDKLLYSSPLSMLQIVAGKYLAACTVLLFAVTISFLYPALLSLYAPLYLPEILTAYLGFILQGCAFIALDLMVTAPTKSSASAAAVAFGANLFVWLISLLSASASLPQGLAGAIAFLSLYDRFVPFLSAQLSPANLAFYLLFCPCMLALTVSFQKSIRMRRS